MEGMRLSSENLGDLPQDAQLAQDKMGVLTSPPPPVLFPPYVLTFLETSVRTRSKGSSFTHSTHSFTIEPQNQERREMQLPTPHFASEGTDLFRVTQQESDMWG